MFSDKWILHLVLQYILKQIYIFCCICGIFNLTKPINYFELYHYVYFWCSDIVPMENIGKWPPHRAHLSRLHSWYKLFIPIANRLGSRGTGFSLVIFISVQKGYVYCLSLMDHLLLNQYPIVPRRSQYNAWFLSLEDRALHSLLGWTTGDWL